MVIVLIATVVVILLFVSLVYEERQSNKV